MLNITVFNNSLRGSSVGSEIQAIPRPTSMSGTLFHEDLFMKIFLQPFFLFGCFRKSSCHLIAKECRLSTGKLPPGGLSSNSVVRITVHAQYDLKCAERL